MQQPTAAQRFRQTLATGMTTVIMTLFGFSGFAAADALITTGPGSTNSITSSQNASCEVINNTNVNARVSDNQTADTGDAASTGNTQAGSADSGDAMNENNAAAAVSVSNAASACACTMSNAPIMGINSISNTGPRSNNSIDTSSSTTTEITNNNNVQYNTSNNQVASSGDAAVSENTTGGSAVSGDANNSNTSNFVVSLVNGSLAAQTAPHNHACDTAGMGYPAVAPTSNSAGANNNANTNYGTFTATPTSARTQATNYGNAGYSPMRYNAPMFSPTTVSMHHAAAPVQTASVAVSPMQTSYSPPVAPQPAVHAAVYVAPVSDTISNTGPGSSNTIASSSSSYTNISNNNSVNFSNTNFQTASTGTSTVADNTSANYTGTGNAGNGNASDGSFSITN